LAGIDAGMEKLNTVFQAASQEMYQAQQDTEGASQDSGAGASGDEEVTDVDFEEVEEEK